MYRAVTQANPHPSHAVPAATHILLLRAVALHPNVEESWDWLLEMPASTAKMHGLRLVPHVLRSAIAKGSYSK